MDKYLYANIVKCIHRHHYNTIYSKVINEYKETIGFAYSDGINTIYYTINYIEQSGIDDRKIQDMTDYDLLHDYYERVEPERIVYCYGVEEGGNVHPICKDLGWIHQMKTSYPVWVRHPGRYTYPTARDLKEAIWDNYWWTAKCLGNNTDYKLKTLF